MEYLRLIRRSACLVFMMLMMSIRLYSQNECPPLATSGCSEWSESIAELVKSSFLHCQFFFTYRFRMCNGVREYVFDDMEFRGVCEAYESFSIYHYTYNSLLDMATQTFLENVHNVDNPSQTFPDCDKGSAPRLAHIYTASCGVWVGCEYQIGPGSRNCEFGAKDPYPDYTVDGVAKVKIWQWQSCGTTCCRRVFEYCMKPSVIPGFSDRKVKVARLVSKQRLLECSEQSKYPSSPCMDGC